MSPVDHVDPDGVPTQIQAGTPSPLPPEQCADALETIEFAAVIELVAARAVGPMGAARIRGRLPTGLAGLAWLPCLTFPQVRGRVAGRLLE